MIRFLFLVTISGVLMVVYGAYIKKQMIISDGPPSPRKARALAFINSLIESADGDYVRVFHLTQAIFILGLMLAILGGVLLLAVLHHQGII